MEAYLVPRSVTATPQSDILRGFTIHSTIALTSPPSFDRVMIDRTTLLTRSTDEDNHLPMHRTEHIILDASHKEKGRNVPGKLPLLRSLIPALIAAVMAETEYLLLPHVTVPEGRARGRERERAVVVRARRVRRVGGVNIVCGGGDALVGVLLIVAYM